MSEILMWESAEWGLVRVDEATREQLLALIKELYETQQKDREARYRADMELLRGWKP